MADSILQNVPPQPAPPKPLDPETLKMLIDMLRGGQKTYPTATIGVRG